MCLESSPSVEFWKVNFCFKGFLLQHSFQVESLNVTDQSDLKNSKNIKTVSMEFQFQRAKRCYFSTPPGWRLATFKETEERLETIKKQNILEKWDRARLLDGWITGPGYNFEMGNDFKGCLGYMLLIKTQSSGFPYDNVILSPEEKEVALFLCADDWNYQVVYWLMTCSNFEMLREGKLPMIKDFEFDELIKCSHFEKVMGGGIPFTKDDRFEWMNTMLSSVARKLGEEVGAARENAGKRKYDGTDSIKEVLSGMIKIVTDEEDVVNFIGDCIWHFRSYEGDEYLLPEMGDVAETLWSSLCEPGNVADAYWSFVCDTFAGYVVEICSLTSLTYMDYTESNQKPIMAIATTVLIHLSYRRSAIIHRALGHSCRGNCAGKILSYAAEKAVGDVNCFCKMLKHNAMWKRYGETGFYGFRDMIWRSDVDICFDEDPRTAFVQASLSRCDEESKAHFVSSTDERKRTALHSASERMNSSLCKLLIGFGASAKAQDQDGMTPLHCALEGGVLTEISEVSKVIDLLIESSDATEYLDLKDRRGRTPLDVGVARNDDSLTAKLLSISEKPEVYFDQVDQKQLLRHSLLLGSVKIVGMLYEKGITLPHGDCDEDGKTAFHLAAMCDNDSNALHIIQPLLKKLEHNVTKQDHKGRTALHEAALNGHVEVCQLLLESNPELIYTKDRDGRNPLYDAVKAECEGTYLHETLFAAYLKRVRFQKDLMDWRGLTPLHVAASEGKAEVVRKLLSEVKFKENYLSREDFVAQTALHKAAISRDVKMVEILLKNGAHPLRERDNHGRTALHYAVQQEPGDRHNMVRMLLEKCDSYEEKLLLLLYPAAGVGTADQCLQEDDPLRRFLLDEREKFKNLHRKKGDNLLQMAASIGDMEMTKDLIRKGYQIADIQDIEWRKGLGRIKYKDNVERVLRQIERIKDQGNDKPAIADSLGRLDYAKGIAALFLNPYTKPPIAVGITGSWGMGKSSLMLQTERVLLTTVAQVALLESSKSEQKMTLEYIYKHIKNGEIDRNILLEEVLSNYDKYRTVLKVLAAMGRTDMAKSDISAKGNVPAILTVRYNAWKYRSDTEAMAGMAVEITRELEGIMTLAQWLSCCWRYAWLNKKYTLWVEIFFPSLIALVLASSLTVIAWIMFDNGKLKEWTKAKYAWPPAAIIVMLSLLTRSIMGVVKPVSTQLLQYVSFPDHTDKLGYQDKVISDITFLKDEIGKKAFSVFVAISWFFSIFTTLWRLITESWSASLSPNHGRLEQAIDAPKVAPASGSNLRIIVFVDDLDRCQDSVILQVLSAINLVLAVCEINVVMGMDKRLIERAIMKKYGEMKANRQELADMYLQKIIQLQLDLPDPSDEESRTFLKGQLGVLDENEAFQKYDRSSSCSDGGIEAMDYYQPFETNVKSMREMSHRSSTSRGDPSDSGEEIKAMEQLEISVHSGSEMKELDDKSSGRIHEETDLMSVSEKRFLMAEIVDRSSGRIHKEINLQSPREENSPMPQNDDRSSGRIREEINLHSASEMKLGRAKLNHGCSPINLVRKNLRPASERKWLHFFKLHVTNVLRQCVCTLHALCDSKQETGTGRQGPSQTDGDATINSIHQNPPSSILKTEMLFVRYSKGELDAFLHFQRLATGCRKLPREWKCLLNYHRLVWYIFYQSTEAQILEGWQLQLATWIFVCWEWQENMNLVIERWKDIVELKISESNAPTLLMIVEYLIDEHERDIPTNSNEEKCNWMEQLAKEEENVAKTNNKVEAESSRTGLEEMDDKGKGKIMETTCGKECIPRVDMTDRHDAAEKSLAELKNELKEFKKLVSDGLMKDIKEIKRLVSIELKEDKNKTRKQMAKMLNSKKEVNMEQQKMKLKNLENWKRMRSTLERYDVTMDCIHAFQRFRFYCIAGYLPRPACEETYDANFLYETYFFDESNHCSIM